MEYDAIAEQLEHEKFMAELRKLEESIFWEFRESSVEKVVETLNDLEKYGDEAVFTDILFDRIVKEAEQ